MRKFIPRSIISGAGIEAEHAAFHALAEGLQPCVRVLRRVAGKGASVKLVDEVADLGLGSSGVTACTLPDHGGGPRVQNSSR